MLPSPSVLLPLVLALFAGCKSAEESPIVAPLAECAPAELALPDGSCIRPGIPPDGCGEGFVHDGEYGCEAILPAVPCPPGRMAVPGENACRPVMPCGSGAWGDLPVDTQTEHVDSRYGGMDSDGSANRPWKSIAEGVAAAAPGALIALADGTYHEDVVIGGKPVRLWGVCPDKVEIAGTGEELGAIVIGALASGTEVGGVRLRGNAQGLFVFGSENVIVDRVWVYQTVGRGIGIQSSLGASSVRVTGSLVEESRDVGLFVAGSDATVEETVVRATLPDSDQTGGRGIIAQLSCPEGVCDPTARARVTVDRSLVEQNREFGFFIAGSDASVEATVVRATLPQASDQEFGRGISVQLSCYPTDVCDPTTRSSAVVRRSIVEQNRDAGLLVMGSDAVVEATVVRGTQPRASNQLYGRGIAVHPLCDATGVCDPRARPQIALSSSLVEDNHDGGVAGAGADVTVEETVVRASSPQASDQKHGRGIDLSVPCANGICDPNAPTFAHVQRSLIEQNRDIGLFVSGSDVSVEATVVRQTRARASDGLFGDGVVVFSERAPARATVSNVRIETSSRTGVANFGAFVSLGMTRIQCAAIALNGESYREQPFVFEDRGDNNCGCPIADSPCKSQSAGLVPPDPE
jgi:hypothetical protein